MLSTITAFFEKHLKPATSNEKINTVAQIQLASAALLIELSTSDHNIDEVETETLIKILKDRFELEESDLNELMTLAQQEVKEATSLYQFTTLINDEYEYAEKKQLIKNMWEVAYADDNLDRYEDYLIRKIADLIYVTHSDFIKTKLEVKAARDDG